jgi:predicted DNA-binding transcriptional regulator AlpA
MKNVKNDRLRSPSPEVSGPAPTPVMAFLTTEELGRRTGYSVQALKAMRRTGRGPKFHKFSARRVRYSMIEVQKWLDSRITASTSA